MLTHMEAVETGAHLPSAKELAGMELTPCPYRNQRRPGTVVRCELASEKLGGPQGVDYTVCKMCQFNGDASAENPFVRYLICHLAFDSVIAGPMATEPKIPSELEISTAVDIIKDSHDKATALEFVESLVYHGSITAERGAELADELNIAEVVR